MDNVVFMSWRLSCVKERRRLLFFLTGVETSAEMLNINFGCPRWNIALHSFSMAGYHDRIRYILNRQSTEIFESRWHAYLLSNVQRFGCFSCWLGISTLALLSFVILCPARIALLWFFQLANKMALLLVHVPAETELISVSS